MARAALLVATAWGERCRFVAELTGATTHELRRSQQQSCHALKHRYVELPVTSAGSASALHRLPAVAGACVEQPSEQCNEEMQQHVDKIFEEGCRDGHPTLSSRWTHWLPSPSLDGYILFMERLLQESVPFSRVVAWDAIYECPAASCAVLTASVLDSASWKELLLRLGLASSELLDVSRRMDFCYEELLANGRQQELLTWLGLIVAALELAHARLRAWANELRPRNPHHEEGRLVWHDYYSGVYQPVNYSEQFDLQWKLALERPDSDYALESSVRLDNCTLNDMIASTFGYPNYLYCNDAAYEKHERLERGISPSNFVTLDISRFGAGTVALDVGCGFGRWTRMLQSIGAKVTSVDASPTAVKSTRRFNEDTHQLSLFELPKLENFHLGFDLVVCWGVLHHTHDPYKGFKMVTSAVREGGVLFIQVYNDRAKAGFHYTQSFRARFHQLETEEERLEFLKKTARAAGADVFDHLDGMLTFYNWVIHEETVRNWFLNNGFTDYWKVWNYKYLGRKRPLLAPVRDDAGILLRNDIGESIEEGRNYPILR